MTAMPSLQRITSNVAAQIFGLAASMLDRIILVGILLRFWGTDVFSDFAVILSVCALTSTADLGMQSYFINVQQAAFVNGNQTAFRRLTAIHQAIMLTVTGVLLAALFLFCLFGSVERLVNLSRINEREARLIFALWTGGTLLTMLRSTTMTIYNASGDFTRQVLNWSIAMIATTGISTAAVLAGAGPVCLAAVFLFSGGAGLLLYELRDVRRRYPGFVALPARPSLSELRAGATHVKWFALQFIAPALWLQLPVLVLNAWKAGGHELTAFLIMRTIANQIRLIFQFAAVGAGIEIASHAHRGEFERAWRLSAPIGILTAVLSAAALAGIICFGDILIAYWTGDVTLFSLETAVYLVAPLVLIAPLQQPVSLLQFANMTLAPGMQKLIQIGLGPLLCIGGQMNWGTRGLLAGLALAEVIACWSVLPMMARMSVFTGLARYCIVSLAAAAAALAWSVAAGLAITRAFPGAALPVIAGKAALWTLITIVPLTALCVPAALRSRLLEGLSAVARMLSARFRPRKP